MAVYKEKWDINDYRFISIWYFIANFPGGILDVIGLDNIAKFNLLVAFISLIFVWYYVPHTLLDIGKNKKIENFFLSLFHKHEWIYTIIGKTLFAVMLSHFTYLLYINSGINF